MHDPPLVSVCIANYNGEHMLADCIDSVLAQDGDITVEIIVHDDASPDDSVQLLRDRYPQVELLTSAENVGFCVANNRMVVHARGEYVLLLNNDAALHTDALAQLLAAARAQPGPAILTLPQYDWTTGALVDRGCLLDPFYNPIPNLDPQRDEVAYVIGACLWIPRDLWHELGGFPEWMGSLAEDLYLCGLARLRGIPVRALAKAGYRHRQGASFGGNRGSPAGLQLSVERRSLSESNKTRALFILTPGPIVWPLLAAHLLSLCLEGLVLATIRRDPTILRRIYLPAARLPFCEWRRLRERRAEAQATATAGSRQWFGAFRWTLRKIGLLIRYGVPKPAARP